MQIEKYIDSIKACRFCFMCRHLSAVGNVTFTEADTPRIRASMLYGVTMYPERLKNPDLIATLYRADLSGSCRRNCVNHYDEVGLVLAARADVVAAGAAPENVKAIADELLARPAWTVSGNGDVAYVADAWSIEAGAAAAFAKLAGPVKTVSGGSCGKGLWVLGFRKEAKELAEKFVKVLDGAGVGTVVVSHPGIYDHLLNTIKEMGLQLNAKVVHSSEFLAGKKLSGKLGPVYCLDSDFLRNYDNDYAFPKQLLQSLGAELKPFGTNDEESYSCAEGAMLLHKIAPDVVEKLAKYVEARADHPGTDLIAVASPYTKAQLTKYTKLNVKTLEELAAQAG